MTSRARAGGVAREGARRPAPRSDAAARKQWESFLARFEPRVVAEATAAIREMRRLVPGAVDLVYDNYNALVMGFGATERASDAILSLAVFPQWVTLCFLYGAGLDDPEKRLKGAGSRVRHVRLVDGVDTLREPAVRALVQQAVRRAAVAPDDGARRRMVIKSISAKQRPRRGRAAAESRAAKAKTAGKAKRR